MDGLTDEQIAKNIGVTPSTLYEWKKKYSEFSEALKRGKEVVDRQVENALLKRALGYQYVERKSEPVQMSNEEHHALQEAAMKRFKLDNPEATLEEIRAHGLSISKYKMVVVEEKTKEVIPDTTAQIFWLKNRKPEQWRDTPLQQLQAEKLKAETDFAQMRAAKLRGNKKDTSMLETLLDGQKQFEEMAKQGAFEQFEKGDST